ncbi:MAG: hypothetical protein HY554_06615 [Elusimicrobia bacterium]|nr:hypothetical protein [Elusimicrobiota bacterium]
MKVGLAVVAALLTACSALHRGPETARSRFPIGIYGVTDPGQLERIKRDGFDCFHTYDVDPARLAALAAEARRQGMRMVIYPNQLRDGALVATRGWPIDAWYLQDEPDVVKMSSATLRALSETTRAWDPERLQTFVIGQGAPASVYGEVGDILMLDWYPVPHRPMETVAEQIDLAMKALPPGKPLWMVVQAYDWADAVKDPVKRRGLRFPNHSELRFMAYASVVHGARGIFFFTLAKQGRTLFDFPELWQAVARAAQELKGMQPIFERGRPIPLPFAPQPEGLEAKAWRYRGRDYVVLLNRSGALDRELPKALLGRDWKPLYEARRDPRDLLKPTGGSWSLRPYQVLVLESRPNWLRRAALLVLLR